MARAAGDADAGRQGRDGAADSDATTGSYGPTVNGLVVGSDTTNRFRFEFPLPAGVVFGTVLTSQVIGSSSEFSNAIPVGDVIFNLPPAVEAGGNESFEEGTSLERDVRAGLTAPQKSLPPVWFYDERGSDLFERITQLDEYYPTRTERAVLAAHAAELAAMTDAHTLVELGSGSSEKTRLLLDALQTHGSLREFVPLDVSESALRAAIDSLAESYPELRLHGVVGDFTAHLDLLPGQAPRLVAFLGSTIGNFLPDERAFASAPSPEPAE